MLKIKSKMIHAKGRLAIMRCVDFKVEFQVKD